MMLSEEQQAIGRRNFLKALAGTPALGLLGAAAAVRGPVPGGPVRLGIIGVGVQGRVLLNNTDPAFGGIRAICDINPLQLERADEALRKRNLPPAVHYTEWKEMLEAENLEGVLIALPLWMHADAAVDCLDAGRHVLCEKMMAGDVGGCERMIRAAERAGKVLEVGYQRRYNGVYQAAYEGIVSRSVLGEVYHARMVWHRNQNWRRAGKPPAPDYDPSRWGYPTFEHLWNWRLYWKYSQGLFAELASHQLDVSNWFLGSSPIGVTATGGVHRFNDGREVPDHVYAIWEYPGGRTVTYSSIESNVLEDRYEVFFGTKATLLVKNENQAQLYDEGSAAETAVQLSAREAGPAAESSETRPPASGAGSASVAMPDAAGTTGPSATREEISRFCAAIRVATPVACGPHEGMRSARACIRANEAIQRRTRLDL